MKKIFTLLKWRYLRKKVKKRQISFKKCMLRLYWIQELETLPQYKKEKLRFFGYSKMKKLFIKEFPNAYLHNIYEDLETKSENTTWKTKCRCGEIIYYYPQKLLLETNKQPKIDMSKRIVSLTCCSNCKKTIDFEFPTEFEEV